MNLISRYRELPIRLRRAVLIWSAVGLIAAMLPTTLTEALGMGVKLEFWCVLLPLMSLAPYLTALVSPARTAIPVRRKRAGIQARRRVLDGRRLAQAA